MSTGVEMSSRNYELLAKSDAGELLEVAMGPHHPSTHGVFRMDVVLDGETVVKLKPVFGCFHRNPKTIGKETRSVRRLQRIGRSTMKEGKIGW